MDTLLNKILRNTIPHYRTAVIEVEILKKSRRELYYRLLDCQLTHESPAAGSELWLTLTEHKYGGRVVNVVRNKVSPLDPRKSRDLQTGGMTGGDRMSEIDNNYAPVYARYLPKYIQKASITLVEVGILKGTGLAVWSDLFPHGHIFGLDIDLSHIRGNMDFLKSKGAFQNNNLDLFEFDQFKENTETLKNITSKSTIDVFIDDGMHTDEAILNTLKNVKPFLSPDFIYFIEDNSTAYITIKEQYPELNVESFGEICVLLPH